MECALCRAKTDSSNCTMCDGSGWLNWSQQANLSRLKRAEHHRTVHSRLESKSEPPGRPYRDQAIEQFMNTHFREHSTAIEKEIEIQDKFVRRFFAPDFEKPIKDAYFEFDERSVKNYRVIDADAPKEGTGGDAPAPSGAPVKTVPPLPAVPAPPKK